MEQALPFKSNEGKHIKFTKKVNKGSMKVEKSKRHSSKLHFHRQVCFLSQGCQVMTQNTQKNTFACYH